MLAQTVGGNSHPFTVGMHKVIIIASMITPSVLDGTIRLERVGKLRGGEPCGLLVSHKNRGEESYG